MHLIWYNPDTSSYEQGEEEEYLKTKAASFNSEGFNVLYEFSKTTMHIAEKIIKSLNLVRETNQGNDVLNQIENQQIDLQ
ncbi:MAG: hypothetical protein NXI20_03715 [bacterium]|nr:hypothetical protein [bacterium]